MISVIIPVYNRERYLGKCMESVLSQSYQSFEVIVVDDGSADSSGQIADTMAGMDSRVHVLHQENSGVSAARQAGIDIAEGDWICFLDSDDILPPDALMNYSRLAQSDVQIIVSGVERELDAEQYLVGITGYSICPALWGKLFRTDFLRRFMPRLPRELVMGEDMIANLVLGLDVQNIATLPMLQYQVTLDNNQSVMKTFRHTFEYELFFFETLDRLFMSRCKDLPYYNILLHNLNGLKMNGFKNVVLGGGSIDIKEEGWISFVNDVSAMGYKSGPSDKLFLKMQRTQWLYRLIMNFYLNCTEYFNPRKK